MHTAGHPVGNVLAGNQQVVVAVVVQFVLAIIGKAVPETTHFIGFAVPSRLLPGGVGHGQRVGNLLALTVTRPGIDPVGPTRTTRHALGSHCPGVNGRTLLTGWLRPHRVTAWYGRLLRPDTAHGGHLLIHARMSPRIGSSHRLVILLATAVADGDGKASTAQYIEAGNLLGSAHGVVHRQHVKRGIDFDALGNRGRTGQQDTHVEAGPQDALAAGQTVERAVIDMTKPAVIVVAGHTPLHVGQAKSDLHDNAPDCEAPV